jgi:hypothetical protein
LQRNEDKTAEEDKETIRVFLAQRQVICVGQKEKRGDEKWMVHPVLDDTQCLWAFHWRHIPKQSNMQTITTIVLIILASIPSPTGGYRYACKDTTGKTYSLMMLEEKNVGDTITITQCSTHN